MQAMINIFFFFSFFIVERLKLMNVYKMLRKFNSDVKKMEHMIQSETLLISDMLLYHIVRVKIACSVQNLGNLSITHNQN